MQAFPVTEEVQLARQPNAEFHVLGVIERKAILKMLQHRIGFCGPGCAYDLPAETEELQRLLASLEQRPFKADSAEEQAAILRCSCHMNTTLLPSLASAADKMNSSDVELSAGTWLPIHNHVRSCCSQLLQFR